ARRRWTRCSGASSAFRGVRSRSLRRTGPPRRGPRPSPAIRRTGPASRAAGSLRIRSRTVSSRPSWFKVRLNRQKQGSAAAATGLCTTPSRDHHRNPARRTCEEWRPGLTGRCRAAFAGRASRGGVVGDLGHTGDAVQGEAVDGGAGGVVAGEEAALDADGFHDAAGRLSLLVEVPDPDPPAAFDGLAETLDGGQRRGPGRGAGPG